MSSNDPVYLVTNVSGAVVGVFGSPQDMNQPAFTGCTQANVAQTDTRVVAYVASLQAPVVPKPNPREWLERLSSATQNTIVAAASQNPAILLWLLKAAGTSLIDVTADETKIGVGALLAAGIITEDESATLLAP